ncbi:MAG: hypothetical protein KIT58_14515 [Planctomycetota bacterium]|nr:hypothetical protein [Planctomycetota bacterium]
MGMASSAAAPRRSATFVAAAAAAVALLLLLLWLGAGRRAAPSLGAVQPAAPASSSPLPHYAFVVGVLSARDAFDRRQAIRATWAQALGASFMLK